MELEYYTTRNCMVNEEKEMYGIEVIKKEYKEQGINIEKALKENISDSLGEVKEIVDTLKKYEVTPIGLEDVLSDILKQKVAE